MKLGLCSVTFRDKNPEQLIDLAMEAKLDAIEWGGDVHVPPGEYEVAKQVGELTRSRDLVVSSYGSYYRLADHTGNEFDFETILETARRLEAPAIRVWAGMQGSADADQAYMEKVAEDARRIADIAAKENISIHLEYHEGTLTDTKESAKQLMETINHQHVFLYWQPANNVSVEERLASIQYLKEWLSNVHIFHWRSYTDRMQLASGMNEWELYLEKIEQDPNMNRYVLMEFVKDDDDRQFLMDAQTLHNLKDIVDKKAT
ncbi:sugar phosphate isomerase/epimerase [Gracilibacillus caseinilyticus]|uniref:Sugar phosphate isomerase/epimerase n=1 Tax=Gracilibacillus caseinilyticus TaxID=2932256 RepID=A0ABY4EVC5_9BACI|nr:TIM barrel protein [Gracilibacillus caseinilyticus]UOQ48339.1 sugar phosphate isomerase/epimerase [Gracilibacillus caseinilyticus]